MDLQSRLELMELTENQGGDPNRTDYFWYWMLGGIIPVLLLLWGWF